MLQACGPGPEIEITRAAPLALENDLGKAVEQTALVALLRFVAGWIAVAHTDNRTRSTDLEFDLKVCRRHGAAFSVEGLDGHRDRIVRKPQVATTASTGW